MNIGGAITAQLLTVTPITDLISDDNGTRLYPSYDPQKYKVYPLAVYKVGNVTPLMTNQGSTGFETADYVIACIGETYADADAVSYVIQSALDGGRGTWSGLTVQGVFLKDDGIRDDILTEPQTEEVLYYIKELTFTASYNR